MKLNGPLNVLVEFPGHGRFWLLEADGGHGSLVSLRCCDECGNPTVPAALVVALGQDDLYACVDDGTIYRNGDPIGRTSDLRRLREALP